MDALIMICTAAVLWRIIGIIPSINFRSYQGHPVRFAALAGHWALIGSGAVAAAIGATQAAVALLLLGLALASLFDRRRSCDTKLSIGGRHGRV